MAWLSLPGSSYASDSPREVPSVLVSHQVNISALTGINPASGEGLILAVPLGVPAQVLARIPAP